LVIKPEEKYGKYKYSKVPKKGSMQNAWPNFQISSLLHTYKVDQILNQTERNLEKLKNIKKNCAWIPHTSPSSQEKYHACNVLVFKQISSQIRPLGVGLLGFLHK
jgi:pyruvate/oxaloacetate carboxyltransferase